MEQADYTAANRAAWNQAAAKHEARTFARLQADFQRPGHSCLDAVATRAFQEIGLAGKAVVQLSCNNGRELLSVKNLGAGRCVGLDIAEEFIAQARRLAAAGGIDCEFVCTDLYDIPPAYDGAFDLAFVSVGTLGWLPDLAGFFRAVARLLGPRGWLFIYEMHPLLDMFEEDPAHPLALRYSYFRREPFRDETGLDYYGHTSYRSAPTYWFHHTLADVIGGCLGQGLALRSFAEHDHDVSNVFAYLEAEAIRPPLSYTLVAQRQGAAPCS